MKLNELRRLKDISRRTRTNTATTAAKRYKNIEPLITLDCKQRGEGGGGRDGGGNRGKGGNFCIRSTPPQRADEGAKPTLQTKGELYMTTERARKEGRKEGRAGRRAARRP